MRLTPVILAAVLFAGAGFGVQQPSEPPPQQGQERKPTLGPAPEPSLSGPRTSATMDARKLMRVRTIYVRSEEHTSELQSRLHLVCRLLLEKKKNIIYRARIPHEWSAPPSLDAV